MTKILMTSCLLLMAINLNAQKIYGDWIKTKVTYIDGVELPLENAIRYQYLRYTFERNNKMHIDLSYRDRGATMRFDLHNNILTIHNSQNVLINSFSIDKLNDDTLVISETGESGSTEYNRIKYTFIKESLYQQNIPLRLSDMVITSKNDTLYKASAKIYPEFKGNTSFFNFCHEYLPEINKSAYFISTFIIRKDGTMDSIQIYENINKRFEKQFRKALNKSKEYWNPAELEGRKVDVQVKVEYTFFTSEQMIPVYVHTLAGKDAMRNLDYAGAISYFEQALEIYSDNDEILYFKAICELNIGNKVVACEDLQRVRMLRELDVESLIEKTCR